MRVLLAAFLAAASASGQSPVEHRLVDVRTIYPPLLQEIRYATTYNFTGFKLYPFPAAYVHEDLVPRLQAIQEELAAEGLGLKIYDGYRPLSVQGKMWEIVPDPRYVSDPSQSRGRHPRGTAVDVTLVNRFGNELKMPTPYDDFTTRAHRNSNKWSETERANSNKLEAVMKKHGFVPFPFEWWHFDFEGGQQYPALNISFEDLAAGVKTTVQVP